MDEFELPPMSHDDIKRFSSYELSLLSVMSLIVQLSDPVSSISPSKDIPAKISEIYVQHFVDKTPEQSIKFLTWLLSKLSILQISFLKDPLSEILADEIMFHEYLENPSLFLDSLKEI